MNTPACWSRKTAYQKTGFIIAAILALHWTWFAVASALGESQGPMGFLMHLLIPGAILLIPLALSLKRETVGGLLFVAVGIFTLFFFHTWRELFLLLALTAPPVAAGVMLIPWRGLRQDGKKDEI